MNEPPRRRFSEWLWRRPHRWYLLGIPIGAVLALLAKTTACTLPVAAQLPSASYAWFICRRAQESSRQFPGPVSKPVTAPSAASCVTLAIPPMLTTAAHCPAMPKAAA